MHKIDNEIQKMTTCIYRVAIASDVNKDWTLKNKDKN